MTQILRKEKVVGKFVEFFGPGVSTMSLADRATIGNMAPEYGATMGFFPVDDQTLKYLRQTGRTEDEVELVERYTKEQGLFRTDERGRCRSSPRVVRLDLSTVEPSLAGPKRPQDRVPLSNMKPAWVQALTKCTASVRAKGTPEGRWEGEGGHKIDLAAADPSRRAAPIPASTASTSTGTARSSTSSTATS